MYIIYIAVYFVNIKVIKIRNINCIKKNKKIGIVFLLYFFAELKFNLIVSEKPLDKPVLLQGLTIQADDIG